MDATETPVVFECEGHALIGMVHLPANPSSRGMLSVVAGGPQYRGGMGRMHVQLARELAAAGVPVMRFDQRGLGDSEGPFRGFEHVTADLQAAVSAFHAQVPGLREVVLWGGCDAAAAVMMNAWRLPSVTGIVLGNPWVHTTDTSDTVAVKHFRRRLGDKDFWLKLIRGQYNPGPAVVTVVRAVASRVARLIAPASSAANPAMHDDSQLHFVARMRNGLARFKGDVLMLMSGRSLVSKEFDELIAAYADWQQAMRSPASVVRIDLPDADQAFSTLATVHQVHRLTLDWVLDPTVGRQAGAVASR